MTGYAWVWMRGLVEVIVIELSHEIRGIKQYMSEHFIKITIHFTTCNTRLKIREICIVIWKRLSVSFDMSTCPNCHPFQMGEKRGTASETGPSFCMPTQLEVARLLPSSNSLFKLQASRQLFIHPTAMSRHMEQ